MGILDFFRRTKNSDNSDENPSPEHIAFSEGAKKIIGSAVEQFGFRFHRQEVKSWQTTIIYRKGEQYIMISGSTHLRDNPQHYNIVLGEGDSEDFSEWDWNSVALWRLKQTIDPRAKAKEYAFPHGDSITYSLTNAKNELLKYGQAFLVGDLTVFYETRKKQTQNREPYKIHTPDKDGNYKTTYDQKSLEQKKKYS